MTFSRRADLIDNKLHAMPSVRMVVNIAGCHPKMPSEALKNMSAYQAMHADTLVIKLNPWVRCAFGNVYT